MLYNKLSLVVCNVLQHNEHDEDHTTAVKKYLIQLYIKVMIMNKINRINSDFKKEKHRKLNIC